MTRFVGLRAKCYTYELENGKNIAKCKGVKDKFRQTLNFEAYEKCIKNITSQQIEQYNLQSHAHEIKLLKTRKIAWNTYESKRYYLCILHSVPYGSQLIDYFKQTSKCWFCEHRKENLLF